MNTNENNAAAIETVAGESAVRPHTIGFIMDGNRRWAKEQGLETVVGHQIGAETLESCITWLVKEQIAHGVFYAFSTENWQRSEHEVSYLMELFRATLERVRMIAEAQQVRVRFIGKRQDFSADLQQLMHALEEESATHSTGENGTTVWVALSYGGRDEIVRAVNVLLTAGAVAKVSEDTFATALDTAELPDPDIIVRTGGEQRLSNFLTWRSVYSELYFIDKYWPALTETDFNDILEEYGRRNRRRGK